MEYIYYITDFKTSQKWIIYNWLEIERSPHNNPHKEIERLTWYAKFVDKQIAVDSKMVWSLFIDLIIKNWYKQTHNWDVIVFTPSGNT